MNTRSVLGQAGYRGTGLIPLSLFGRWLLAVGCRMFPPPPKAACALTPPPPHLRTWRLLLTPFILVHSSFCLCAQAQYSIDCSTIDTGGGISTGGVYAVTGTIGQPDAGTMSGGSYTLSGGFWGILAALQTPGAPDLWVARTETNTVCVWWAVSATTWQLRATTNLVPGASAWSPCAYTTNGATCLHLEPSPAGNKFYRLTQ